MAYPDAQNMTQLATLRAWLSVPSEDTAADAALTALIGRASAWVCSRLGRDNPFSASYTEAHNGRGNYALVPKRRPVTAVSSVKLGRTTMSPSVNQSVGYLFDEKAIYLLGAVFTIGVKNVEISYTAGWSTTGAEQKILEQCCLELCAQKWRRRDHVDQSSQSLGGLQSLSFSQKDVPAEVESALAALEEVVPVW